MEQKQPLRAVEPDEWAMKVRAKPIPETPTHRQRDVSRAPHLPPVPWCPACVSGKDVDDPYRRRPNVRDSGLDVASFGHCDISAEVGMFNKKLKFKVFVSHRSGAGCSVGGSKRRWSDSSVFCWRRGGGFWCVCVSSSVRMSRQRSLPRTLFSGQGNSRRFRGTRPGIHMAFWVTVNQPSERWRNRFVQCCFKCTLITIATATSFPPELPIFPGW